MYAEIKTAAESINTRYLASVFRKIITKNKILTKRVLSTWFEEILQVFISWFLHFMKNIYVKQKLTFTFPKCFNFFIRFYCSTLSFFFIFWNFRITISSIVALFFYTKIPPMISSLFTFLLFMFFRILFFFLSLCFSWSSFFYILYWINLLQFTAIS